MSDKYTYKNYGVTLSNISEGLYSIEEIEKLLVDMKATKKQTEERLNMIKRVSELMLGGYESVMYYCTVCNRPYKALHEANEHAKFCGKAVPTQPVFRSYTTAATLAATFEEDDDTQVYAVPWQGLTDEEYQQILIQHDGAGLLAFYNLVEAALKKKNT